MFVDGYIVSHKIIVNNLRRFFEKKSVFILVIFSFQCVSVLLHTLRYKLLSFSVLKKWKQNGGYAARSDLSNNTFK